MCDRWLKQRLTGRRTTAVTRVVQLYAQNLTEQHGSNKGKLDRDLLERWADYVHGVYVLSPHSLSRDPQPCLCTPWMCQRR